MISPPITHALGEFLEHFAVEPAVTADQTLLAGRLRHQVYCEERGYEATTPSGIETDQHDVNSLHCVVTHRRSGVPAGCVRLICASEEVTLAMEDYCRDSLHIEYMQALGTDRDRACEVSRLAVAPAFRMLPGKGGDLGPISGFTDAEQRCCSLVTTATFLSAIATADLCGRSNVFGVMAAPLPRLLRRIGIGVSRAGDFIDYHGRRAPHFITVTDAITGMHPDVSIFYESIRATLSEGEADEVAVA